MQYVVRLQALRDLMEHAVGHHAIMTSVAQGTCFSDSSTNEYMNPTTNECLLCSDVVGEK